MLNNLNVLCNHLHFQFALIEEKRQRIIARNQTRFDEQKTAYRLKQQVEQVRIVQEQKVEQARIAKKRAEAFACRRCSVKFSNNIKLHIHVQDHHQKKSTKSTSELAVTTSLSTSKAMITMSTFSATSSSSSESALKLTSSIDPSESIVKNSLSITSSVTSKQSISKHQHQKQYLTIEDLFEMFAEKLTKSDCQHIKKRASSSSVFSLHQTRITFYFRSAANQSKPISQSSKTSNSRSLHQHTSAKSIRTIFSK